MRETCVGHQQNDGTRELALVANGSCTSADKFSNINTKKIVIMGVVNEQQLDALQNWQRAHETLPQNIDRRLLQRYLLASRNDLAKAQELLEFGFRLRNQHADIFVHRDPCSAGARQVQSMADMIAMPTPTPQGLNIMLLRFSDPTPELLNFNECIRMFFMVSDVRLLVGDANRGETPIFDMQGLQLMHFPRLVLSTIRLYMRYTQDAHPALVKHLHVINCSTLMDRCLAIAKPLIRSEVFKTIHFHLPGSDTLYDFVPRELLPFEYGGKAGSLADIRRENFEQLAEHRDYLMDPSRWQMRKPLKETPNVRRQHAEQLAGNFRTLCID